MQSNERIYNDTVF